MPTITPRQNEYVQAIRRLTERNGRAPRFDEVAEEAEASPTATRLALTALRVKGVVAWERRTARSLRVLDVIIDVTPGGDRGNRCSLCGCRGHKSPTCRAEQRILAEPRCARCGLRGHEARNCDLGNIEHFATARRYVEAA